METNVVKEIALAVLPVAKMERKHAAALSSNIFDDGYLKRLRAGDEETAKHFNAYFRRMLRIKLWSQFGRNVHDDLLEDVMAAALEKILSGEPRDPACLPAYVRGICANLAKRPGPNQRRGSGDVNFDQISDQAQTPEEELISQERARTVRTILTQLLPRERLILTDLFYHDLDRDNVCRKYNVSREQLRLILFRARGRFQKRWPAN